MSEIERFWCHEARNVRCVREADYDRDVMSAIAAGQRMQSKCSEIAADNKRLREALEKYADDNNWCYDTCDIGRDIAKAALAGSKGGDL